MKKKVILVTTDILIFAAMAVLSQYLLFVSFDKLLFIYAAVVAFTNIVALKVANFYKQRIKDSSIELVYETGSAFFVTTLLAFAVFGIKYGFGSAVNRYIFVFQASSCFVILLSRIVYRLITETKKGKSSDKPTAVIYGAGMLGTTMARLGLKDVFQYSILAFLDDNLQLKDRMVMNYPVLGTLDDAQWILAEKKPNVLVIAITKLSSDKIQKAVLCARNAGVEVKIVPSLFEIKNSKDVSVRDIDYADLLGRSLISIEREPLEKMFTGKTVLVTGAGGSIGSEICNQLMSYDIKKLILLDIDETELHDLCLRLLDYKKEWSDSVLPVVCDIRNGEKLERIFKSEKPDIVFHAAAYKHVPLMELYPEEAVLTNVPGSYNVFMASHLSKVDRVVVISTDKAVNPTNIMGATKRCVEKLAATFNRESDTDFVCVRFGNVIGSRGSMLPLFLEEIKAGRPITVTDRNINRYFMAIPEAVSLVFRAASLANGGEVMVLDMGERVNIYDFAQKLISVFGDGRSTINITGLRPGEKLYEELLADKDNTIPTQNQKIFKAKINDQGPWTIENLSCVVNSLKTKSPDELRQWIKETVPEYHTPEK